MGSKGDNTRERILDVAQENILKKGFSATSIDDIIDQAFITKGGFFYHFKGKNELALCLVERYLKEDDEFFAALFSRAESLSEDPLQQMLLFLKLLAEAMADLPNGHPGCLVASYVYESLQFEENVMQRVAHGVLEWRRLFSGRFKTIEEKYPARIANDTNDLADALTSMIEGGVIVSLVLKEPKALSRQLLQFRNYVRLLYNDI